MSFFLTTAAASLRRGGGEPEPVVYDPDYQAVLDYATANSIPLPTQAQQDIDNQLIIDYKATGAWTKDDVFFKFKGTADPSFKLICWKRLIQANAYGSLTWSTDGVKGNGTNAYIDSKFTPSTDGVGYQQTDAAIMYTGYNYDSTGSKSIAGVYSGNTADYALIRPYNGNQNSANINGVASTNPNMFPYVGLVMVNRVASKINIVTDIFTELSTSSSGLPFDSIYILARHRADSGSKDMYGDFGIGFMTFGASKVNEHSSIKTVLE